jgi:hypothetical protein
MTLPTSIVVANLGFARLWKPQPVLEAQLNHRIPTALSSKSVQKLMHLMKHLTNGSSANISCFVVSAIFYNEFSGIKHS